MSNAAIETALEKWATNPTAAGFQALRRSVLDSGRYQPYPKPSPFQVAIEAIEQQDYRRALEAIHSQGANLALSPQAYELQAQAYRGLGDLSSEIRATKLAEASLQGILKSGDGSTRRPYQVLHISDEYQVLAELGATLTQQELNGYLDLLTLGDGRILAFSIRDMRGVSSPFETSPFNGLPRAPLIVLAILLLIAILVIPRLA